MLMRWFLMMTMVLLISSCGAVVEVTNDGTYEARVPTTAQFEGDARLPGGFRELRESAIDEIAIRIAGDEVTIFVDGSQTAVRAVTERIEVIDSEGSGPFKARMEVIRLGDEPLILGGLSLEQPAIWPGTFEDSPVITVKSWDPNERGPSIACGPNDACLLLTSGVDPIGRYEDANDPALEENPIESIDVEPTFVEFTLDTGEKVRMERTSETLTATCGLSETLMWDVPAAVGLALEDPVLVHTLCPTAPGAAVQLVIMERGEIPELAQVSPTEEAPCQASSRCLWFVPAPI